MLLLITNHKKQACGCWKAGDWQCCYYSVYQKKRILERRVTDVVLISVTNKARVERGCLTYIGKDFYNIVHHQELYWQIKHKFFSTLFPEYFMASCWTSSVNEGFFLNAITFFFFFNLPGSFHEMLMAKRRYLGLPYIKLLFTLYTVLEAHKASRGREEMTFKGHAIIVHGLTSFPAFWICQMVIGNAEMYKASVCFPTK